MTAPLAFDAATVIIARESEPDGHGLEILLIARHPASRFAAGEYVFPGGRIEPEDAAPGIEAVCAGLSREEAARRLADQNAPDRALGFWVGAIREVFEEVGLLFAYGSDGALVPLDHARLVALQQAYADNAKSFSDLIRAHGLRLATDRLHYYAYWITPEERKLRFSTRFFVAEAPEAQEILLDTKESTEFRWLSPQDALAENGRGSLPLHFPTIRILRELCEIRRVDALLAAARGRMIRPIMPRIVVEDGRERFLMPGDPGYY